MKIRAAWFAIRSNFGTEIFILFFLYQGFEIKFFFFLVNVNL